MHYDSTLANLSVLLTLTPLVVGCGSDDDTEDSPASVVQSETEGASETWAEAGSETGDAADDTTGSGEEVGDDDPLPATTTGSSCESPFEFEKVDPVCTTLAEAINGCDVSLWDCPDAAADYCEYTLRYTYSYGPECSEAYHDLFACMSALDCAGLNEPLPCAAEMSYVESACEW
ncbi:MAG: hypothetical protein AAF799_16310 [Myxococcota bacterium]